MQSGPSPILGLVGFWMLMRLVGLVAVLAGSIYGLYCLTRMAAAAERVAAAIEGWNGQAAGPQLSPPPRYEPQQPPLPIPGQEIQNGL